MCAVDGTDSVDAVGALFFVPCLIVFEALWGTVCLGNEKSRR